MEEATGHADRTPCPNRPYHIKIPGDTVMDDALFKKLQIADEDEVLRPYTDTKGKLTIGIGRNLTDNGIRKVESDFMFSNDVTAIKAELNGMIPWWNLLTNPRQMVLASMAFNMGTPRLLTFKKMLAACRAGDYPKAAAEILDSKAARDAPNRYGRLAVMMERG